ncbi:MAG: trans-acting enoyl reductase family protein [Vicinamibacteria bacterium]
MNGRLLLYGANGYTGELIARLARRRGVELVLAGRAPGPVSALASELGFASRSFGLDDPAALDKGLDGISVVLHCAGPFSRTSRPMAEACLRRRAHYLDITGEIEVFEALAARDAEARAAGVMLLPGSGFDVVPSDCLAAHLKRRLPGATRLALAFRAGAGVSRGTATTMVENLGRGGCVRVGGRLTRVPVAWKTRAIDFGRGPRSCMTIPWGDVATAYHSTGIPDVEVYASVPARLRWLMTLTRPFGPLLRTRAVRDRLVLRVRSGPPGPSAEERARGRSQLWGEASDANGARVVSRLDAPEGYTHTADAALTLAVRALGGEAPPGFKTPSLAHGPDFVLGLEGVRREDV